MHESTRGACSGSRRGQLADPVTLKLLFEEDEALRELDGARYLGRLAHAAETIINAAEYGRIVHDLALKRGLIRVGEDTVNRAFDACAAGTGREQIEIAEQRAVRLGAGRRDHAASSAPSRRC